MARKPWTLKVEGVKELQDQLGKIIDRATGTKAKDVYYRAGALLRDQARRNAPYDPGRKKGTHLRDAIFCDWGDPGRSSALVGVRYKMPGAPHAHLVEFGTQRWSGHPFFRPAIAQTTPRISETIAAGLSDIITKVGR